MEFAVKSRGLNFLERILQNLRIIRGRRLFNACNKEKVRLKASPEEVSNGLSDDNYKCNFAFYHSASDGEKFTDAINKKYTINDYGLYNLAEIQRGGVYFANDTILPNIDWTQMYSTEL